MTYLFLHPIMHLLLFLSPDWLTFCHVIISYKFTRFFIYFLFLSDEGPNARNVRPYYPYWQYTDLFIFRFVSLLCLRSTLRSPQTLPRNKISLLQVEAACCSKLNWRLLFSTNFFNLQQQILLRDNV